MEIDSRYGVTAVSLCCLEHHQATHSTLISALDNKAKRPSRHNKMMKRSGKALCSSFEPADIEEKDELERLATLTQRDYLIRSYGIMDQVYQMMKQAGNIRVPDMIKYGIYEKSKKSIEFNEIPSEIILPERKLTSLIKTLPKIRKGSGENNEHFILKSTVLQPPWGFGTEINSNDDIMRLSNSKWSYMKPLCNKIVNETAFFIDNKQEKNLKQLPDLKVTCNEAAIFTRPNLPGPTEWPSTVGAKSTRSFIARHFSNTLKLQDLESRLNYDRETKVTMDRNLSINNQIQSTL